MPSESKAVPFFIVGCSRSGSTLLQTLIDAHPSIAIPPESQIYTRFGSVFAHYGDFSRPAARRRFIRDLLRDAYIRKWNLDVAVEDLEARAVPSRAGVIRALFELYAEREGADRWGDKSPEHVRWLAEIRRDFPQARLIHLVRDGRDVAEAFQRMIYGPVSPLGLGREWARQVAYWRAYREASTDDGLLEVRYEDLVREPREVLRRVFDFIDEPFIDTTEDYADTRLSTSLGTEPWHGSLQRGIRTDKIGIYRERFSAREVEIFESVAGEELTAYGYSLEYDDPVEPQLLERVHALVADHLVRWYRKLFQLEVVLWDVQGIARNAVRRFEGFLTGRTVRGN